MDTNKASDLTYLDATQVNFPVDADLAQIDWEACFDRGLQSLSQHSGISSAPLEAAFDGVEWTIEHGASSLLTPPVEVFENPLDIDCSPPLTTYAEPTLFGTATTNGLSNHCVCDPTVAVGLADALQHVFAGLRNSSPNSTTSSTTPAQLPSPLPVKERLTILRACSTACEHSLDCSTCQNRGTMSRLPSVFLLEAVLDGYTALLDATRAAVSHSHSIAWGNFTEDMTSYFAEEMCSAIPGDFERLAEEEAVFVGEIRRTQNILAAMQPKSLGGDPDQPGEQGGSWTGLPGVVEVSL